MATFLLKAVSFIVGTIAHAATGSISNFLFLLVALSGGMFGKNIGGGIGAVISFGFSFYKFFEEMAKNGTVQKSIFTPGIVGILMIAYPPY